MKAFIKPVVKFSMFPLINVYIEYAYEKVVTYTDFVSFINHCFDEAETTKNDTKRLAYTSIANALYSIETNISYESKSLELLIDKL